MEKLSLNDNMSKLPILEQIYHTLTPKEKREFLRSIGRKLPEKPLSSKHYKSIESYLISNKFESKEPDCCPICGSVNIVKNGKHNGKQRYKCHDCGKSFGLVTSTIIKHTKKDIATWQLYVQCMMSKFSLRKCAQICGITVMTAFMWRHKILSALQNMMESVRLDGIIEADETYARVSYKGNHSKSKTFVMPRDSHERGYRAKKRGLSKEQVSIQTAINLNGLSIAKVNSYGKPKIEAINKVLGNKIAKGSVFVTDGYSAYERIAKNMELNHVKIPKGKRSVGAFNIQLLNNYHQQLKNLINIAFKGVSTKHLNNYLVYHNLVNFSKGIEKYKQLIMEKFCLTTKCNIRWRDISIKEIFI